MGDDMDAVRSKGLEVEHSLDTLDTTLLVYIYFWGSFPAYFAYEYSSSNVDNILQPRMIKNETENSETD